jgi:hypothetical protein
MDIRLTDFYDRSASLLLFMCLLADLSFVTIHFLHNLTPYFADPLFNIELDNGYAEKFQYLKYLGIIFLFGYLCVKRNTLLYISWALLFAYFLADDAFQLHERMGTWIAEGIFFKPPFRLRTQDLGELVVTITAGMILLPSFLAAYYFGPRRIRLVFHDLLLLLAVLLAFAVGIDMVHAAFIGSPRIELYLGVIEDGGELIAVSLFLWYVFLLARLSQNMEAYLLHMFFLPSQTANTKN